MILGIPSSQPGERALANSKPLSARDAYRLWAPTYDAETAVSVLENQLVTALTPPLEGQRLLDAGCGTGRRLAKAGAAVGVGVDFCREMLDAGIGAARRDGVRTMLGDLRALPLTDRSFDIVWCRLAIGHVAECGAVYAELARVADRGAWIIVSDFHPETHRAGHRRTFRHGQGVQEIEHFVHDIPKHLAAAGAAGLAVTEIREDFVGASVRDHYARAGKSNIYDRDLGLPLVLALSYRKPN